jgi:hypothetical protein
MDGGKKEEMKETGAEEEEGETAYSGWEVEEEYEIVATSVLLRRFVTTFHYF